MRRTLFLLIVGLGGAAILIWLGVWQIQRLAWKEAIIADINTRIAAAPYNVPLIGIMNTSGIFGTHKGN